MRQLNLRVRSLLFYIMLAVIPTVIIFLFYTKNYIEVVEKDAAVSVLQTLRQASLNISNEVNNARRISDYVFMSEDVILSLRTEPGPHNINDQITEIGKIRNILISAAQGSDIRSLRLYVDDNKIYARQRIDFYPLGEFFSGSRFSGTTSRGEMISTYPHKYVFEREPVEVVSFARLIRDTSMIGETIGAVVVDIEESKIFSFLEYIEFPNECLAYVADENGYVISRRDLELYGQEKPEVLDGNGAEAIRLIGSTYYISVPVDGAPWFVAAEMPRSSMRSGYLATRMSVFIYLILLAIFIGALLAVNIISINGITLRVQGIANVLVKEWGGGLARIDGAEEQKHGLYSSLDRSLLQIRLLIKAIYEQMEIQRRTQLQLLQSQINPHFLYNTLDTVQWMVRADNKETAEEVIRSLTCYLRLILNNGRDEVTVADEVSLARAYVSIQKHRFGDAFDLDFIIEPDAAECLLPKLTIQPVIENAINHGLLKLEDRRGRIDADIYAENGVLNISITDNGVGMSVETIGGLMQKPGDKQSGFGLFNVNQRILLFSEGDGYGVFIDSEEGKYTTVHLKIAQKKLVPNADGRSVK